MIEVIRSFIKQGNFDKFVKEQLSMKKAFDDTNINYTFPIEEDPDPENKAKRKVKYEKSRQLLLRAAKVRASKGGPYLNEFFFPGHSEY